VAGAPATRVALWKERGARKEIRRSQRRGLPAIDGQDRDLRDGRVPRRAQRKLDRRSHVVGIEGHLETLVVLVRAALVAAIAFADQIGLREAGQDLRDANGGLGEIGA
jgi:hypothetical protein